MENMEEKDFNLKLFLKGRDGVTLEVLNHRVPQDEFKDIFNMLFSLELDYLRQNTRLYDMCIFYNQSYTIVLEFPLEDIDKGENYEEDN